MTLFISCSGGKRKENSGKGVETVLPDIKNEVSAVSIIKR